jgi:prevent-host-death family protein
MQRAQVAQLEAHLSQYVARVRHGKTVVVCDRRTPIAKLVPSTDTADDFVMHEPTRSTAELKSVRGIKPKRRVDVIRLRRESRRQR